MAWLSKKTPTGSLSHKIESNCGFLIGFPKGSSTVLLFNVAEVEGILPNLLGDLVMSGALAKPNP